MLDIDTDPLATLHRKQLLLCDLVTAVAGGFKTGLFLYGNGGVGKSFAVFRHLEKLGVPYKLHNSRMTAKGLFLTLQSAPDAVHVLEDMERITRDGDAQGVLRSALWSQPGHDREVTWTTAKEGAQRFLFRGGLILLSNCPLANLPELRALATRIEVHRLEVTGPELEALMRKIAGSGFTAPGKGQIEAAGCNEITDHLLSECRQSGCPLDLRLQQKAFATYLQWVSDHSANHWRDLVAASIREAAHRFRHEANTATREERIAKRRKLIREIMAQTADAAEQQRLYTEQTGASRADFFRRKYEIGSGEFEGE